MKVGIFNDDKEIYDQEKHIRNSVLKEIRVSPAHFKVAMEKKWESKEAFDIGTVAHSVLLEQDTSVFVAVPEDAPAKPTEAQMTAKKPSEEAIPRIEWWKNFREENKGKIILSAEQASYLNAKLETFTSSTETMKIYDGAFVERSHYAKDPVTGLYLKARPDIEKHYDDHVEIGDLKTTAQMPWFGNEIWKLGYYFQAGYYAIVLELTTGKPVTKFKFVAQEKERPFGVKVFTLSGDQLTRCMNVTRGLINRASVCIRENSFPCYDDIEIEVTMPDFIDQDEFLKGAI